MNAQSILAEMQDKQMELFYCEDMFPHIADMKQYIIDDIIKSSILITVEHILLLGSISIDERSLYEEIKQNLIK